MVREYPILSVAQSSILPPVTDTVYLFIFWIMKHTTSIIALSSMMLLGACSLTPEPRVIPPNNTNNAQTTPPNLENTEYQNPSTPETSAPSSKIYTIKITSAWFSPSTLTINVGDTVQFVNTDTEVHWPASASHPTHKVYPGSDIQKCGTSEQSGIFDACKGLAQNEAFTFTFNQVGSWGYHDHLNAKLFGKITVETKPQGK